MNRHLNILAVGFTVVLFLMTIHVEAKCAVKGANCVDHGDCCNLLTCEANEDGKTTQCANSRTKDTTTSSSEMVKSVIQELLEEW